jgi:hypothetical protein
VDNATSDLLARSAELRRRSAELGAHIDELCQDVRELQIRREEIQMAWEAYWAACRDMTRAVAPQPADNGVIGLEISGLAARPFVATDHCASEEIAGDAGMAEEPDLLAIAMAISEIACETMEAATAERLMALVVSLCEAAEDLPPDSDPEPGPGRVLH